MIDTNELRNALSQNLKIEAMLGVRQVPVSTLDMTKTIPSSSRKQHISAAQGVVEEKRKRLTVLDDQHVKSCVKCGLAQTRTKTVFGQGHPSARLVFVGEAPGADEDRQGLAFVGKAGQLLTKMIVAMQLSRDDVFICNVLKCRPPNNREPAPEEIKSCSPYLFEQLEIINPEIIVALGAPASKTLLNTEESIGRLRGRFHDFYLSGFPGQGPAIPLMPTYHPAYLLRNPPEKGKCWSDLKMVMSKLGIPLPS